MTTPLHYLTIAEAAALIRTRQLSPVDLVRAHLARIEALDGAIHAYITVTADAALAAARKAESEIAAGRYLGPLHGIPFAHKDIVWTRGVRTTAHSHLLADWVPGQDAAVHQRLVTAGAILLGKTALHEFAYGAQAPDAPFPPARNPWNLDRSPGGSSSGSGAAVAAGLAMGATGTDTGGSIRHPAAVCGIVGLKPTYGRVSNRGVLSLAASLDHVGPMTRSVRDNAILLQAMAGHDPDDIGSADRPVPDFSEHIGLGLRGMRIGIPQSYLDSVPLDADVAAAFETARQVLHDAGAEIVAVDIPGAAAVSEFGATLLNYEAWQYHRLNLTTRPERYGPNFRDRVSVAAAWSEDVYLEACARRLQLREAFAAAFRDGIHAFINTGRENAAPTLAHVLSGAPDQSTRRIYNVTGMPAIVLPMGFDSNGVPMGLQIACEHWAEPRLYQIAAAYEHVAGWAGRHPALDAAPSS